jgi:hypothetical protein
VDQPTVKMDFLQEKVKVEYGIKIEGGRNLKVSLCNIREQGLGVRGAAWQKMRYVEG